MQLHSGHQGLQRTLAIARSNVFWLQMAKDITQHIEKCGACETTQRSNVKEPLITKQIPSYPFQIVATDLFSYKSREFILIVDSYSGYFDFRQLKHSTSKELIEKLKSWYSTHGIPEKLESDNGPQYSSAEFRKFATDWCFTHSTSSPKYPQSNGLAERFVQTAKNMLRKCDYDQTDIKLALLTYRNTPRSDALGSPNQRLMSRTTRSHLTMLEHQLKPQIIDNVQDNLQHVRDRQKHYHDRNVQPARQFSVGDKIRLQKSHRNWTGATVMATAEKPRSFIVRTDAGQIYRRNTSQIHKTRANMERSSSPIPTSTCAEPSAPTQTNGCTEEHSYKIIEKQSAPPIRFSLPQTPHQIEQGSTTAAVESPNPPVKDIVVFTRSGRQIKPVVKMNI